MDIDEINDVIRTDKVSYKMRKTTLLGLAVGLALGMVLISYSMVRIFIG